MLRPLQRPLPLLLACMICAICFAAESEVSDDHPARMRRGLELFGQQVRTVLVRRCIECHGVKKTEGGLNLLTRKGLLAGGDSGAAVVPGRPDQSRVLQLVAHEEEPHMPLDRAKLSDREIEGLREWIANEAPYDEPLDGESFAVERRQITDDDRQFWSFLPLRQIAASAVEHGDWCETAIDPFVLAGLKREEVLPAAPATREKLIRRAKLDLLGLPPTPEETDDFVNDQQPDAWPRLIDRLLASPNYGERWGRHWLDVVRFAESYGFEHDLDNLNAYHYRDFVIRALNDDMPFDQFVRWQIAGDELSPSEPLAWMATGFLAAGVRNADIAKIRVEQERYDELDDIASTIGTSMLGLSIGCSRCHDHKFDPLSQEDYYRFIATFERTIRGEVELSIEAGQPPIKVLVASEGITPLPRIYSPPPAFYEKTWFLRRGDAKLKDHEVSAAFPVVLTSPNQPPRIRKPIATSGPAKDRTYRRTQLAMWMTDTEHGAGALLARVMANRIWQHHFGRGIVATPNDFGNRGERPTQPKLLEWLANELVASGWDVKHLHRLILTSSTWRQAVLTDSNPLDAQLFRGHEVRRLEAETIRDSMLAASGELASRMYGPGTLAQQQPRRSVYFRVKRSQSIPMMTLFDAPDPLQSIGIRAETTVAPQALALMNATHIRQLAARFAHRLAEQKGVDHDQLPALVRLAYQRTLGRVPTDSESGRSVDFIRQQQSEYSLPPKEVTAPPAADAIVFRLDSAALASQDPQPAEIRSWGDNIVFSAITEEFPVLELAATSLKKPAVRFGPAATILRAKHPKLNFGTGDFSISVAFRIDGSASNDNHILGKDSYAGTNSYSGYFLQHIDDRLKFCTRSYESAKGASADLLTEPFLRKGQWYRATGIRHAGTISLYIDGADSAAATIKERQPINVDNEAGFKIGDMDESPSNAFSGSIAEVLLFDRALTPDEVYDCHTYLGQRHLLDDKTSSLELALTDFCQALFCLNEFIYVE